MIDWKIVLKYIVFGAIALFAIRLLYEYMDAEYLQELVDKAGPWGPVIIVVYVVISHVFAPIFGSPGFIAGAAAYGVAKATLFVYIGGIISAPINFYIGRRWGRKAVLRFAGKNSMEDIDDYVQVSGTKMLIMARTLGAALFDIVSYAVGLTNMKFRDYYLITIVASAVPAIIQASVFENVDAGSDLFYVWLIVLVVMSVIFVVWFKGKVGSK